MDRKLLASAIIEQLGYLTDIVKGDVFGSVSMTRRRSPRRWDRSN